MDEKKEQFERECCMIIQQGWRDFQQMVRDGQFYHPYTTEAEKKEQKPATRERIFLKHYKQELVDHGYFVLFKAEEFSDFASLPTTKSALLLCKYTPRIEKLLPVSATINRLAEHNLSANTVLDNGDSIRGNLGITIKYLKLKRDETPDDYKADVFELSSITALGFKPNNLVYSTYYATALGHYVGRIRNSKAKNQPSQLSGHAELALTEKEKVAFQKTPDLTKIIKEAGIDKRTQDILLKHFLEEESFEAISKNYGVSKERIRQLNDRGLRKIRLAAKTLGLEDFLPPIS